MFGIFTEGGIRSDLGVTIRKSDIPKNNTNSRVYKMLFVHSLSKPYFNATPMHG